MYRRNNAIATAVLAIMAVDAGAWAGLIIIGLYGCSGTATIGQCALGWVALTVIAVLAKICIGANLLFPASEKASRTSGRYAK